MTDSQWAERITALAKDKVSERLTAFERTIRDAVQHATNCAHWSSTNEIATLEWLVAEIKKRNPGATMTPAKPEHAAEWLKELQCGEEKKVQEELLSKLDIFGQLRKAKGEDWTPAATKET